MPEPTTQQEREARDRAEFELWFGHCVQRYRDGEYVYEATRHAWNAWQAARSLPPTDARVRELQQDAARWQMLVKILCYGLRGAGYGRKFKLIETCPMYGDESEVTSITTLIDAALAQQEGENKNG